MANNRIQIKRSPSTAVPASLSPGELAYSNAIGGSGVLFIGSTDGGTVVPIGGVRNPGTLTANQALVANSTSGIDKIITANLTLSGASVSTINAVANLTHLGTPSNTELTTTWGIKTFVDAKIAQASNPQGSNGQFQYNNSGILGGTDNFVYDNSNGRITVGNSSVNVQLGYTGSANALAHFHGNLNQYVQVIMNNVNTGALASSDYVLENDVGTETTNFLDLGINSSNYNDPAYSAMGAGDSYLYASNNDLVVGTADATTGELRFITGGTNTSQIRATVTIGGNVGIGNTAPNARLQVTGTANISGLTTISSDLVLGAGLNANGSTGTAGQVLTSNGVTGSPYWSTSITGVTAGSGLTGGGTSGSLTLNVGQGNGTSISADAIEVVGGSTLTVNATGVHVNSTLSITDLTLSGNLTVLGDLVSLNVATISVEDSMITLAKDQSSTTTFTDAVDIGFFGTYGNTSNAFISGIFRDQSDSGIWKLFTSNGVYTNSAIDTANTSAFRLATLQTFLTSGGLSTNSTSANLIANSTYTVGIVANAITLSGRAGNDLLFTNGTSGISGLALGFAGYVLQSNGSAITYDTLDGGTF